MTDTIKIGHEKPVNKQAALLLAKPPWWAYYPEPAKKAILEIASSKPNAKWDDFIVYTNPPPEQAVKSNAPIFDQRGKRIRFKDGDIGTVIGFAGKKLKYRKSRNYKPQVIHQWWVEKDGTIIMGNWDRLSNKVIK